MNNSLNEAISENCLSSDEINSVFTQIQLDLQTLRLKLSKISNESIQQFQSNKHKHEEINSVLTQIKNEFQKFKSQQSIILHRSTHEQSLQLQTLITQFYQTYQYLESSTNQQKSYLNRVLTTLSEHNYLPSFEPQPTAKCEPGHESQRVPPPLPHMTPHYTIKQEPMDSESINNQTQNPATLDTTQEQFMQLTESKTDEAALSNSAAQPKSEPVHSLFQPSFEASHEVTASYVPSVNSKQMSESSWNFSISSSSNNSMMHNKDLFGQLGIDLWLAQPAADAASYLYSLCKDHLKYTPTKLRMIFHASFDCSNRWAVTITLPHLPSITITDSSKSNAQEIASEQILKAMRKSPHYARLFMIKISDPKTSTNPTSDLINFIRVHSKLAKEFPLRDSYTAKSTIPSVFCCQLSVGETVLSIGDGDTKIRSRENASKNALQTLINQREYRCQHL